MDAKVDEIGGDVVIWPPKLMRMEGKSCCGHRRRSDWRGCRVIAIEVDEIGGDVVMWPPKLT